VKRPVKAIARQLYLPLRNSPALPLAEGKQKELTTALAELLISGFRQTIEVQGTGGEDELEADN
jgi:hypothetical protein